MSKEQEESITKKEATFHARQSSRAISAQVTPDNDTWVEHLAVVDMMVPNSCTSTGEAKYELQIRSFFESKVTGNKTWDEPPSGAQNIEYANEEVRRMAEAQKKELECVSIPSKNNNGVDKGGKKGKITERVFRLMRRSKKNVQDEKNTNTKAITYKKDSDMARILQESKDLYYDPDTDLEYALVKSVNETTSYKDNLEYALAQSANETTANSEHLEEEEELALAKAMSLSMKETSSQPNKLLSAYASYERTKNVENGEEADANLESNSSILSGYSNEEIAIAKAKIGLGK